jgi:NAD(P)-dependent dehydrogenase (short-subunit alcohol dehydrogenase family)
MLLNGRVVVVTGAAKRIGRAIALRLAREGAQVAIHYNGSEAEARATAAECDAIGSGETKTPAPHGNSAIFRANLESVADIEALFTNVEKHFGRIDGLVNNAGRFTTIDPLKVTESDWDFIHSVNLKAAFFCAQQAAKRMIAGDGGRIVNISSLGGLRPWSKNAHYCASKAGVIMLTKALAKSFAPKVTVNSVAPGAIVFGEPNELEARLVAKTPACRAGTAEDIADAVLFFLTTTSFITGQVIAVDGGLSQK